MGGKRNSGMNARLKFGVSEQFLIFIRLSSLDLWGLSTFFYAVRLKRYSYVSNIWNNVFPWSTLEVQKEVIYVNISFTLFSRLLKTYIYSTVGMVIKKHKSQCNKYISVQKKQIDRQAIREKQTNEQLSNENCSQFAAIKIMTRVAGEIASTVSLCIIPDYGFLSETPHKIVKLRLWLW